MKNGKNLVELATEIERQAKSKKDYLADTRSLALQPSADLQNGFQLALTNGEVKTFPVRALAHGQLAERVGIPVKYYDRMRAEAPQLLAENVNHWFRNSPDRRMIRTIDGEVRALLSDKYQRIDNFDVANVALPIFRDLGLVIASCEITESRLYIKGTTPNIVAEVKGSKRVGDFVEAGVALSNSEVGFGALSVKPFYKFLACLNGMVRDSIMTRAHIGRRQSAIDGLLSDETKRAEDSVVLMKLRDVLKGAMDAARFQAEIDKMVEQTTQMIQGSPVKAIEVLSDGFLSDAEEAGVLRHLIEGHDLSRYGLMNAVTRLAEDVKSYDRATEIETFGGSVIDLPFSQWKEVAHAA